MIEPVRIVLPLPIIGLLLRAAVGWVCRSSRASLLLIEFMKPLTD
jgi:hypothetical protein